MKALLAFLLVLFGLRAGFAQDDGFSLKIKPASAKPVNKKTVPTGGTTGAATETLFLNLEITTDLGGTVYLGDKATKAVKAGEPVTLPVYRESTVFYFKVEGEDEFAYKEQLSFPPDQKGSRQERFFELEKKYQIYRRRKANQTERERVLDGIFNNMITLEPNGAFNLKPYEICAFEVSLAQYALFVEENRDKNDEVDSALVIQVPSGERYCRAGIDWRHNAIGEKYSPGEYEAYPVANVNWYDATAFCQWLSKQDPDYTYRLPRPREWEYAAGCGYSYQYPWGNDLDVSDTDSLPANTADLALKNLLPKMKEPVSRLNDHYALASPRGQFQQQCLGLYDMGGNVAEWIDGEKVDKINNQYQVKKMIKGGSFYRPPKSCAVLSSFYELPHRKSSAIGFRVVRESR